MVAIQMITTSAFFAFCSCVRGTPNSGGWEEGRSNELCQVVAAGEVAHFGVADTTGCDSNGGFGASGKKDSGTTCTEVACEAPKSIPVCDIGATDQAGEECLWKVSVPPCAPAASSVSCATGSQLRPSSDQTVRIDKLSR